MKKYLLTKNDKTVTFIKNGETWNYKKEFGSDIIENFEISNDKLNCFLIELTDLGYQTIEVPVSKQYSFNEPECYQPVIDIDIQPTPLVFPKCSEKDEFIQVIYRFNKLEPVEDFTSNFCLNGKNYTGTITYSSEDVVIDFSGPIVNSISYIYIPIKIEG